jgi:hypothetical protein
MKILHGTLERILGQMESRISEADGDSRDVSR